MGVCGHYGTWCWRGLLIWMVCFLAMAVVTVDGIRCHVCEGVNNNDLCNTRVAECTDSGHDACYTRIQRPDQNIKTYSKGCTNYDECRQLQNLNDDDYCSLSSSDCRYCCDDKSTCNAYNAAQSLGLHVTKWRVLAAASLLGYLTYQKHWTIEKLWS